MQMHCTLWVISMLDLVLDRNVHLLMVWEIGRLWTKVVQLHFIYDREEKN